MSPDQRVSLPRRRYEHGVAALLKIYAHCIDGQAAAASQLITRPFA